MIGVKDTLLVILFVGNCIRSTNPTGSTLFIDALILRLCILSHSERTKLLSILSQNLVKSGHSIELCICDCQPVKVNPKMVLIYVYKMF